MRSHHIETHRAHRIGWLRASVLGANDGVVSVASLVVGMAASGATAQTVLLTGIAGLVAGAMSMAAGEYVSVQSQADTEEADLRQERAELAADPAHEMAELSAIYMARGLDKPLAQQVAPSPPTPETSWASPTRCAHAPCKQRWPRRRPSAWGPLAPSSPLCCRQPRRLPWW
jgi:hypothetical protein